MKGEIERILKGAGACTVRVANAAPVEIAAAEKFDRWLAADRHAGMRYMTNHAEIRRDPRLLLDGASSIICTAFCYDRGPIRNPELPKISYYALFPDYHDWIRDAIRKSGISDILGIEGEDWRICVDSAPINERYWAWKSGIGIIGDNGAIIVPGIGNRVFLTEIITNRQLDPDKPLTGGCGHCGGCRRACPTGALQPDGTIDCNRCISYLTIEHRGPWLSPEHVRAMSTPEGRATLFGCDRCMEVCPHNQAGHSTYAMPDPIQAISTLTCDDILNSAPEELSRILKGSALKRAGITGLQRNATDFSCRKGRYC